MENIVVIGTRKEAGTQKRQADVKGNCVNTVNRLDSLVNNTLTALVDKHNPYYTSGTFINKRLPSLSNSTFPDTTITGNVSRKIMYTTSVNTWSALNSQNLTAFSGSSPSPTAAAVTALNAGDEISLFGSTYWTTAPAISTQQTAFYSWNAANERFSSSGNHDVKLLVTLNINMYFQTLPAGGYFIYRIRDNSGILTETRVYNTGNAFDINKTNNFSFVVNSSSFLKFTVQYVGDPLARYPFAMGASRGNRVSIHHLT